MASQSIEVDCKTKESEYKIDISNLATCAEETKTGILYELIPTDYDQLLLRLISVKDKFSPLYKEAVVEPFISTLMTIGKEEFEKILAVEALKRIVLQIAQVILQRGQGYKVLATDAFQEVVNDLYDSFLSAEDRIGIKPPDLSIITPMVGWAGAPDDGPFTLPSDITNRLEIKAPMVFIPSLHAERGLMAWACIPHEVCGHDILHADIGLIEELAEAVKNSLIEKNIGQNLPEYWASRIDETASDVLGVLNLGPSAAIGLIGFIRGMLGACTNNSQLRNCIPETDDHPIDILRGYLAAYATGFLEFSQAKEWEKIIEAEVDKDLFAIQIGDEIIAPDIAKASAKIVAETIMKTKLKSLENHSLSEIQNWRNADETIVLYLRKIIRNARLLKEQASNLYAAHIVAAAVIESMSKGANVSICFERMISLLKEVHDYNLLK